MPTFTTELTKSVRALDTFDFTLPNALEASAPPEARGLRRDQVRLLTSCTGCDCMDHGQFEDIGQHLRAGDVLAINTSATLKAAVTAMRETDGAPFVIHFSTRMPGDLWTVEVRVPDGGTTRRWSSAKPGERYVLPEGGIAQLLTPYAPVQRQVGSDVRLWVAVLDLPLPVLDYLDRVGRPIRYSYVPDAWDIGYYQTVYANSPGSAEMPSAGRAFTPDLITALTARGVQFAPLVLHTGVASLEENEPPYEEQFHVPASTAALVNAARGAGRRVIAVGTTVVRALETVTDDDGVTHPGEGWTDVVISPERGVRAVDGLITGFHEPRASHLAMLEALAPRAHLMRVYHEAIATGYLWHEFGDLHLLIRG